jgi:CrcB protein
MAPTDRKEHHHVRVIIAVAAASALGGLARYLIGGVIANRSSGAFPWETFLVNITGAFVLGFLFTLFSDRLVVEPWLRTALLVGFLGSYTTFSTWTLESYRLIEDGAHAYALANLLGSLVAGVLATYAGVVLGRAAA